VNAELNRTLRDNRYTGPAISFPNLYAKTPKQQAEEKQYVEAIKKPAVSRDEAFDQAFKAAKERVIARGVRPGPDGKFDPQTAVAMVKEANTEADLYKDITPNQRKELQRTGLLALTPGPVGDAALKKLQKAVSEGETQAIRNTAAAQIQMINKSPQQPSRDESGNTITGGTQ
jgi:hypothetical protein